MQTVLEPTDTINSTGMVHLGCETFFKKAICGSPLKGIPKDEDEPIDCIMCSDLWETQEPCLACGEWC